MLQIKFCRTLPLAAELVVSVESFNFYLLIKKILREARQPCQFDSAEQVFFSVSLDYMIVYNVNLFSGQSYTYETCSKNFLQLQVSTLCFSESNLLNQIMLYGWFGLVWFSLVFQVIVDWFLGHKQKYWNIDKKY